MDAKNYKLEIFIPPEFVDSLLDALADVGAGIIGNYERCASIYPVSGTWRPAAGANPYQGQVGKIETASEMKVEMNCPPARLNAALAAVRQIHPYEEPLINIIPLINEESIE